MNNKTVDAVELDSYLQTVRDKQQNMLIEQAEQSFRASRRRWYRFVSWAICIDRVERHFRAVANESKAANWLEHLYVNRIDAQRTIQLFFGRHPVTGFPADKDNEMVVEHGATLVVSQGPKGDVIVLMYPFESKKGRLKKPRIIWNHFSSPVGLVEHVLVEMVRDFLIYARASSVVMAESSADSSRLEYLENRSRAIEGSSSLFGLHRSAFLMLVGGSAVTAALYLAWIFAGMSHLEPWTGLVALITGWFAYLFQQATKAIENALVKEEAENQDREQERRQVEERAEIEKERLSRVELH